MKAWPRSCNDFDDFIRGNKAVAKDSLFWTKIFSADNYVSAKMCRCN